MSRLLACGLVLALGTTPNGHRFGVAGWSSGEACAAIPGPEVAPGAEVTLVTTEVPQRAFRARVQKALQSCPTLERALVRGPYFLLEGDTEGDETIAALVVGGVPTATSKGRVELQPVGTRETFTISSCTSQEGVHIAAWLGEPITGRRLWHVYWYLGYDVEASCTSRETAE